MNIIKRILQTVAVVLGGLVSLSFPAQACDPMSADCLGGWAYADGIFDPQGIAPSAQSLLAIDDIDGFKALNPTDRISRLSASSRPSEMWHYRGNMLGWGAKRDGSHASGYQHGRAYPVTGQVTLNFLPGEASGAGATLRCASITTGCGFTEARRTEQCSARMEGAPAKRPVTE